MTTLRQGDRGPAVRELQFLLLVTGHDPGPLDGVFGPRTWIAASDLLTKDPMWSATSREVTNHNITALRTLPRRAVEVPRILTPVSAGDMRIALVAGYASVFGDTWDTRAAGLGDVGGQRMANAVRVALAQLCVEHGCRRWGMTVIADLAEHGLVPPLHLRPIHGEETYIYFWCNNVGNRQVAREDREKRPFAFSGHLGEPLVPWFSLTAPEGDGSAARDLTSACYAFANAAEGAAAYWRFLRDHCPRSLAAFERGDPADAAHQLKIERWRYSGGEAEYSRAMVDRFRSIA